MNLKKAVPMKIQEIILQMYRKQYELESLNAKFENGNMTPLSRDKFKFLKLIGAGGFGKVYQVYSTFSKNHYAMKVLSKNQIKHYSLQKQLKREIDILDKCRHQFIVKLYACFEDSRFFIFVYQSELRFCFEVFFIFDNLNVQKLN